MPPASSTPGIVRRLACMAYESLLILATLIILLVLPHTLFSAFTGIVSPPPLLWAHALLLLAVYFGWFWSAGRQTPAMKTWKIRVETQSGSPLTLGHASLRLSLAGIGLLLGGISILWAIVDRDGLFLHDRLAGTRLTFTGAQPTRSSRPLPP